MLEGELGVSMHALSHPPMPWSLDLEGKKLAIYTERTNNLIAKFPSHCDQPVFRPNMKGKEGWRKLSRASKGDLGDFPGGAVVKNPPGNAGDTGSSPGPGRSHMPWSN